MIALHSERPAMRNMTLSKYRQAAFSLLEMSIVLVVVALISTNLLSSYAAQRKISQFNETQKNLDAIKEALIGFAQTYGRLPCPAVPKLSDNQVLAGMEDRVDANTPCSRNYGALPWASLGISGTDTWGRRYTYFVSAKFSAPLSAPGTSSFSLATGSGNDTAGTASIKSSSNGSTVASDLPAVIVSHGPNGFGAFTTTGLQISGAVGDELENANNTQTFIARSPDAQFDDQVSWLIGTVLKSRMVSAGKLP